MWSMAMLSSLSLIGELLGIEERSVEEGKEVEVLGMTITG